MDGLGYGPDKAAVGRIGCAVVAEDGEAGLAGTGAGCDGEEAEGFIDDGKGVGKLVDEMG